MIRRLGQRPFTTDLKQLRVALGKAGLAQPSGWLPFTAYESVPYNLSANSTIFVATVPRDITIYSWVQTYYVDTTNDGSNYWDLTLRKAGPTTLATVTTSAASADTWTRGSDKSIAAALSGDVYIWIRAEKTGSPGNLYLASPAVFVI